MTTIWLTVIELFDLKFLFCLKIKKFVNLVSQFKAKITVFFKLNFYSNLYTSLYSVVLFWFIQPILGFPDFSNQF
jgi:hypothetical protein